MICEVLASNIQSFLQQVNCLALTIQSQTTHDDRKEGDVVWFDVLADHPEVHLEGVVNLLDLNTGLNHTSVNEDSWLDVFLRHLVKDAERLLNLAHLLINLGQDRKRDVGRLDAQFLHVFETLQSHLGIVSFEAAIKQRVVQHFVRRYLLFKHFLMQNQSVFNFLGSTVTLDERGVRYQVWLTLASHSRVLVLH